MSEQDENQVIPEAPEQIAAPAVEETKELSLTEELAAARKEEPENQVEEVTPEEAPKVEVEPEAETPIEKPEEQKPEDAETERKRHNYEMAQKRIQERETQKRQVEQTLDQHYKPQAMDELTQKYLDQGYDEFQAQLLARDERRDQQAQLNEDRATVAELNAQRDSEAYLVMQDFPVFNPNSPDYDKGFADKAYQLYALAADEVTDPKSGLVVSSRVMPYNFYKELADMRGSGISQAQIKAQKAAEAQMASVQAPPSNAPPIQQSAEDKQASSLEAALNAVR